MTHELTAFQERLHAFRVDSGDESLTFVRRLARENGWSHEYAERVFREYKRFAFLCVVTDHPCTPSDQVDQAWHLHLTYTRSYWDHFCGEVLGQPLHHNPTQGGKAERQKFAQWYDRTRTSYRAHFGEEPPIDIWPPANVRFGAELRFRRVNTAQNWVVPKPRPRKVAAWATAAGGSMVLAGCAQAGIQADGSFDVNPLTLFGIYLLAMIPAIIVAVLFRRAFKTPPRSEDSPPDLNRYEIAYLAGGAHRIFATAFVRLVEVGAIDYDENREVASINEALSTSVPEPERIVYDRVARSENGIHVGQLGRETIVELGQGYDHLTESGFLLDSARSWQAIMIPMLITTIVPLAVLALTIPTLISGGDWEGMIGLQLFVLVTGSIATLALSYRPRRSRLGDQILAREHQRLAERELTRREPESPDVDLSGMVALNGVAILHATMFASMMGTLEPPSERQADPASNGWDDVQNTDANGDADGLYRGFEDAGCGGGCGGCGD